MRDKEIERLVRLLFTYGFIGFIFAWIFCLIFREADIYAVRFVFITAGITTALGRWINISEETYE